MVLKLFKHPTHMVLLFENDVKMYGTQTKASLILTGLLFENDVKMYGTQTKEKVCICIAQFENDVKMYGTQTNLEYFLLLVRLRMM